MYFYKQQRFILLIIVFLVFLIQLINYKHSSKLNDNDKKLNLKFSLEDRNNDRWKELEKRFENLNMSLLVNPPYVNKSRTIKYQCTSVCGGLGDRIRGLIMSYFLSLLLNRQLVVEMNWPCKFDNYFESNKYKWISSSKYKFIGSWFHISAIDHNIDLVKQLQTTNFIETYSQYDNIQMSTNMDFLTILFSNIYLKSHPIISMFTKIMSEEEANIQTLFSLFFEILLKPKKQIVNLIDNIMLNRSLDQLICIHLRIGKNPSNPRDYQFNYSSRVTNDFTLFLSKMNSFQNNNSSTSLFISSDSNDSIQQIKNNFSKYSFYLPGPILQIDLPIENIDCDQGFTKVVADFYLLSECETLILTNSGFSAFANRRRKDPYKNIYKYNTNTNIIQRCLDLRSYQGWEHPFSISQKLFCPVIQNNFTIELI